MKKKYLKNILSTFVLFGLGYILISLPIYNRLTLPPVADLCQTTGDISLITRINDIYSAKKSGIPYWHSYCVDHQKIYFWNREIKDADLESFRTIPVYDDYAYDKKGLFFQDSRIYLWSGDDNYIGLSVKGDGFITNGKHIWASDFMMPNTVDIKTFLSRGNGYSTDVNNVYFMQVLLSGADVDSFVVMTGGYAKDKNNIYFEGKIRSI